MRNYKIPTLTIAGSDSSGGAGVQADLKTFSAIGTYGMSVITAITAQNTMGVFDVEELSRNIIKEQMKAVFEDIMPKAVKIGMVSSPEIILEIVDNLKKYKPETIVVDPVMISKSGYSLLRTEAKENLIKYLILAPMLLSVVVIDYKLQIIPNRLNLTMFEIGLVFAFLYGFSNVAISINMLLGMLAGGGIFLIITLLGGLVYGKEAMGLGDVKLMGALGLYFGLTNIIIVSLVSFLICAIISIFLLATKIKKTDEYIPFGPFIVVGAFISIFVPSASLIGILMNIFTLGLYSKNN